jgi:UDP-N-acetylmuramate--alanine ligase
LTDRDALVQGLRNHGHRQIVPLDGSEKLAGLVAAMAKPGDYIVCLGAGSITQWAYALPAELAAVAN